MRNKCYNAFANLLEDVIAAACTCLAGSSVKCLGKCNHHVGAIFFALEDFNRKKLKRFVEPLTYTSQLSKQNIPRDPSSNPAPIDKTLVRIIKFGDNTSTEVEPKNQFYDPRAPNKKYLDNNSMNTLKKKSFKSVYLPVDFFYSTTLSRNVQKKKKKKKKKCDK